MCMIKILHSGDWHLDAPFQGRTEEQAAWLRRELLKIPEKVAAVCLEQGCQLVLLAGDLFDGAYTQESFRQVCDALKRMAVPVFIAPGNHDFLSTDSPYEKELWPENVHIFKRQAVEWVDVPQLGLRVYGAGFQSMDCPALLEDLRAEGMAVGVFHGDPTQTNSAYNPVSKTQVTRSGLRYLALGHVHSCGSFRAGDTLCAWPGCPMGRGWDEDGKKGLLVVTLDGDARADFVPLDVPGFYDLQADAGAGIGSVLPAVPNEDLYRVTLTGECELPDLDALRAEFSRFPNLVLRDRTRRPVDLWENAGEDSFAGMYFGLLKEELENAPEDRKATVLLAAKLSRQLLDGQEVALP